METSDVETTLAPAPKGASFAKRGFKSTKDVEAEGMAKGEAPPEVSMASAVVDDSQVDGEGEALPEEFKFESPGDETQEESPEIAAKAAPTPQDEGEYRIGDKTFKTQKEAWGYAEELERQNLANDAFRQGLEAAQTTRNSNLNPEPQKPPEKATIPDLYYTDPAEYFRQRELALAQQAQTIVDQRINQNATHRATMDKFWADYPDLGKSQATINLAKRHLDLGVQKYGNIEVDKALKLIAEDARRELKELGVTTLPTKTLNSNSKMAASPGSGMTVPKAKTEEKVLNFVEQMRQSKHKRFMNKKGGRLGG